MSDWAHIATHYKKGRLLPKSNPYFGETYFYLNAIHLAHSTEQMNLIMTMLLYVFEGSLHASNVIECN